MKVILVMEVSGGGFFGVEKVVDFCLFGEAPGGNGDDMWCLLVG